MLHTYHLPSSLPERPGPLAVPLGQEPLRGKIEYVSVTAGAVVGGHEVVADHQREGEHAAGLDLLLVGTDRAEQQAQVVHAPVVDAAEPGGDRLVTPGPVADSQVDRQQLAGERERARQPQLGPDVAAVALDALEHLID